MAEMLVALLIAGLVMRYTDSGRALSRGVWRVSKGPGRRAVLFGARQGRRAGGASGRAAGRVGRRAADRAASRWNARAAPTVPVARAVVGPGTATIPESEPKEPPSDPEPQPTTEDSTVNTEIESPSSDGELLSILEAVAQAIRGHAASMEEFEGMLAGLNLDRSVVGAVDAAAGHLADAADQLAKAGQLFESVYEDVRETARKGMHFRGEDAA